MSPFVFFFLIRFYHSHLRSSQYTVTHERNKRGVTLCGKSKFPYYKELLIKERIRSLWEQILSFNRLKSFT